MPRPVFYGKDVFDRERYQRVREIAAEMVACKGGLSMEKVRDLFCCETGYQTPKLDSRAAVFQDGKILLVQENIETLGSGYFSLEELPPLAVEKNTTEQVAMCFEAHQADHWTTVFD